MFEVLGSMLNCLRSLQCVLPSSEKAKYVTASAQQNGTNLQRMIIYGGTLASSVHTYEQLNYLNYKLSLLKPMIMRGLHLHSSYYDAYDVNNDF